MYNTYLTSRISLRTRGSLSFNDYSHCSNERYPFASSSLRTCCPCCVNSMYKLPISPNYCYNLYGLRQSSLIQWSPCRKLISCGYDRCYYSRVPVCNVDRSCYCDRVCNSREKSVGVRKGGSRKCKVFDERCERYDVGGVDDEVDDLLSLLSEDIDEECLSVRKETRRPVKKPVIEKTENGEVSKKSGSKKKRIIIDVIEDESGCEYESVEFGSSSRDNRRVERIHRDEDERRMERIRRDEHEKRMERIQRDEDERRMERIRRDEDERRMERIRRDVDDRREERIDVSKSESRREYELAAFGSRNKDNRRDERTWRDKDNRREERFDVLESEPTHEYESMDIGSRSKDKRREERIRRDKDNRREERIDVSEHEPRYEYGPVVVGLRNKEYRRNERNWREEEREALLREENRRTMLREENKESLFANRAKREREEWDLFRKTGQKDYEKLERESVPRKENWKVIPRTEEREDLLRREEQRNRLRRDGSSCSSYYSVSSTGDYDSDNEIELREGRYIGETSGGYKRNSRNNEVVYLEANKEDRRYEGYREEHRIGLNSKNAAKGLSAGSNVVESEFRKTSEKKLADVPMDEKETRKETLEKRSNFSVDHESKYRRSSDYVGYEDRKANQKESIKIDHERKQQHKQTGDEVSAQYKQFVEIQDKRNKDEKNSYGSQQVYSGKGEMPAKVASLSHRPLGERRTAAGIGSREDKFQQRNSGKVAELSEVQEFGPRKTPTSHQEVDTGRPPISQQGTGPSVKKQDNCSDNVRYSYGSQDVYSGKSEVPANVPSSSQQTVRLGSKEDESYQRNPRTIAKISEIQEIDLRKASVPRHETDTRKTSISQQGIETNARKKEDYSTDALSSIKDDEAKQLQRYDQVGGLVESRGKSQQLTKKEGTSVKRQPDDKLIKQEENTNLAHGSSSKDPRSQTHAKIIRTENSSYESNELTEISITHLGESGSSDVEDRNKMKLEILVRSPSSESPSTSAPPVESNTRKTSGEVDYGSLQSGSTGQNLERSQGEISKFVSPEDAIGSAARLEKASARYVDEFVDKVKNEIAISEIQKEKNTDENKSVPEELRHQKSLAQNSSGDSQMKEQDSRKFGTKGPSDEMWNVDEPSAKPKVLDDPSKGGNAIVKRSGRSIWNVIADVVHLRWSAHSESHSSSRKTGGRSSPNQSTSSETWFSGHEPEEHEVTAREKERRSITQDLSGGQLREKARSQFEEGSSSSILEGDLKRVRLNTPSSSSAENIESSFYAPALKLQRSPVVRRTLEAGEVNASDSGMSDLLNTGSVEQPESSASIGELKQRKFQRKDQFVRDRFDEWEEAYRHEAEQRKVDEMFMREALVEAKRAADNWEVPVGAVLVQNGKIIARGCNLVEELRDSTAHAEMICIREASNALRTWRLSETTLYVTLEPCPMCAGAILQARIDTVVWGAPNKLLGADGSWIRLFPNGDSNELEESDKPPAPVHPFHPKIVVRRRVLASECADTMQQFFQLRRKKDKKPDSPNSPPSCLPITNQPTKLLTKMHDIFHIMFCL